EHLGDAALFDDLAFTVERVNALAGLDRTRKDAAGQDAAEEGVALDGGDQHAERAFFDLWLGNVLDDLVEKRGEADARAIGLVHHPALLGSAVENRKIELFGRGIERDEEVEHLFEHFEMTLVGLVDLVDGNDRLEALGEGLAKHEL